MRTGGLSSFEALVVSKYNKDLKFLLHSEGRGKNINKLLNKIAVWEGGNAEFLIKRINAYVTNTELFKYYFETMQEEWSFKFNKKKFKI